MAITLELGPDVEELLKDEASATGLSVEKYLEDLVAQRVGKPMAPSKSPEELREIILKYVKEFRELPTISHVSDRPAIEYDDFGLPI